VNFQIDKVILVDFSETKKLVETMDYVFSIGDAWRFLAVVISRMLLVYKFRQPDL